MVTIRLKSFNKLLELVKRKKGEILGTNFEDRSTLEDEQYIIGGDSLIIKPQYLNLYINLDLKKIYGRDNLTLKIFFYTPYPIERNLYNCHWGQSSRLFESTSIQNMLAYQGYAPVVVDLGFMIEGNKKYAVQIVEYVDSDTIFDNNIEVDYLKEIEEFCFNNGIMTYDLGGSKNMRNKKIVDFQGYRYIRKDNIYGNFLIGFIEKTKSGLSFGGDKDIPYQSIEELGIKGRRNNLMRGEYIDFSKEKLGKNWSVLDIGCNGGYFLRRSMDNGASIAIGVDLPDVNKAAHWLNNYLGYFNAHFQTNLPDEKFDIVLFLSGLSYYDLEEVVKRVKKIMIFEGHGGHTAEEYLLILKPYFNDLKILGYVNDYPDSGERVIIRCQI